MPDETPEDRSETMEGDLHKLEDHIDDAKAKAATEKEKVEGALEDVAGEPAGGDQDAIGGDDPEGADDGREPDEVANPT